MACILCDLKVKTVYTSHKLNQLQLENHRNIGKYDILRGAQPPASYFQNYIFGESTVLYVHFLAINKEHLKLPLDGRNRGLKCQFDLIFNFFSFHGRTKEDT